MKRFLPLAIACLASPAAAQNANFYTDTRLNIVSTANSLAVGGNPCAVGVGVNGSFLVAGAGINAVWSAQWCRRLMIYQAVCAKPSPDCVDLRRQLVATEFETAPPLNRTEALPER